jgi:hypothetical protein
MLVWKHRMEGVAAAIAVVALVVGGVALAGQLSSTSTSVTGCLGPSGDLTKFAIGDLPLKPCTGNQVQVHLTGSDLVSLVVGNGLTSVTENGVTTISVDPAYALPQGCEFGQVAKWDGSGWFCANDETENVGPLPQ